MRISLTKYKRNAFIPLALYIVYQLTSHLQLSDRKNCVLISLTYLYKSKNSQLKLSAVS